jgi:hypothetical protein
LSKTKAQNEIKSIFNRLAPFRAIGKRLINLTGQYMMKYYNWVSPRRLAHDFFCEDLDPVSHYGEGRVGLLQFFRRNVWRPLKRHKREVFSYRPKALEHALAFLVNTPNQIAALEPLVRTYAGRSSILSNSSRYACGQPPEGVLVWYALRHLPRLLLSYSLFKGVKPTHLTY